MISRSLEFPVQQTCELRKGSSGWLCEELLSFLARVQSSFFHLHVSDKRPMRAWHGGSQVIVLSWQRLVKEEQDLYRGRAGLEEDGPKPGVMQAWLIRFCAFCQVWAGWWLMRNGPRSLGPSLSGHDSTSQKTAARLTLLLTVLAER